MRTWRRVVIAAFVLCTGLLFYRWWSVASTRAGRAAAREREVEQDERPGGPAERATTASPQAGEGEHGEGAAGSKLDRARADRLREQIRAVFAEAGALGWMGGASAEPAAPVEAGFPTMPQLPALDGGGARVDPQYIKDRIHEDLFPLARGCYADALKRDPKVAGKLVLSFSILGDPKIGGVVDKAKLLDDTTIADPELQTCVRESLMSVSFAAPPGDGEVSVVYPIVFSPEDDEAGADR
jgi:hypothetical protein